MDLSWPAVQHWLTGDGLRIVLTVLVAIVVRWLVFRSIGRVVAAAERNVESNASTAAGR